MLDIAVVDDEVAICTSVSKGIERWSAKTDTPVTVRTYANADQFEFSFGASSHPNVVFLDIALGAGKDGVALARQIRTAQADVAIIFLTADSSPKRLLEGYEVQALDYLVKPVENAILEACLDRVAKNVRERADGALVFSAGASTRRVLFSRIVYLEAEHKSVTVHTRDGAYRIWKSLVALEKELPPEIVRCSRSVLVNLRYVESVRTDCAALRDGTRLAVSRRYFGPLREQFVLFSTGCTL